MSHSKDDDRFENYIAILQKRGPLASEYSSSISEYQSE
jgi:acetone carboxylase gamma subunit